MGSLTKEGFFPIKGWEKYHINEHGVVWTFNDRRINLYPIGKELKKWTLPNGYVVVFFKKHNKTTIKYIHRMIAEAFIPNPDNKKEVNHKDGDKSNHRIDNLEWVTPSENQKHSYMTGLNKGTKGEISGWAKVTSKEVVEIRKLFGEGECSQEKLAKMYGLSAGSISKIVLGKQWAHIPGALQSEKQKIILDTETGVFYEGYKEAALYAGISFDRMFKMLNGYCKNKTHYTLT